MDQNSALKKDVSLAERKLLARNERIQQLEVAVHDAQERLDIQDQRFAQQMTDIRLRLDEARCMSAS